MRVVLYTPTYYASPGTQARVDLVRKSLEMVGYKTILITSHESQLQSVYHTLGKKLLTLESVWKVMGRLISRPICKQRPRAAILFIDISASAIPYLKKCDINTILSIEDLTPEYKNYNLKASNKFYQILRKYADQADAVISSSYALSKRLERIGLKAIPVPVGLEPHVSLEEALVRRAYPPILLHAGQLNTQRKMEIILALAHKYKLVVHNFGSLASKLSHPNIEKYRKPTLDKAMEIVKRAHIGVILEHRKAYTLTRLYFHVSLLQPIITEGCGPWVDEANCLGVNLHPLNAVEEIVENYNQHVREYAEAQKRLAIPHVHKSLLSLI